MKWAYYGQPQFEERALVLLSHYCVSVGLEFPRPSRRKDEPKFAMIESDDLDLVLIVAHTQGRQDNTGLFFP